MSQPTTSIAFSSSTPAPPAGDQDITIQSDGGTPQQIISAYPKRATSSLYGTVLATAPPLVIGFVLNNGATGTNVGPMLAAARAGTLSKCVVVTKASDPAVALTFAIKQNGVAIFTAAPTIASATASGTVSTFTALTTTPLPVAAGDVFSIDITSGSATWQATVQVE